MNTFTAKKVRQAIRKRFFENNFCPPPFSPSPSIVDVTADYPFRLQEVIKKSVRAGNKRAVLRYTIAKPKATENGIILLSCFRQGERITQNGLSQQDVE